MARLASTRLVTSQTFNLYRHVNDPTTPSGAVDLHGILTQRLRRVIDEGIGYGLALEGITAAEVARIAAAQNEA